MALHEQAAGKTDERYTPSYVFEALGCRFDVDVAAPTAHLAQWVPAEHFIRERSLAQPWRGFVWMNPPFGGRNGLEPWLTRFFRHGNGIALTPDRTSAPWWQAAAAQADAVLFVAGKIKFIGADGKPSNTSAQGTTLMAAGKHAVAALKTAQARGLGLVFGPLDPHTTK